MKYKLGQKVKAIAYIVKDHEDKKQRTFWRREKKDIAGIIVGKRTLSEGHKEGGFKHDGPDNYDYESPIFNIRCYNVMISPEQILIF